MAAVTAAGVSFVLAILGVQAAHADDPASCGASVADSTSAQVLDVPKVTEAISTANQTGVDIYVRAFETAPGGSLDAFWQNSVSECANWRNGTAGSVTPKGNVVLITFSMDHKSAVFYGPAYNQTIGDAGATNVRNEMNGFLKGGDFTGGVIHAVQKVGLLTDPAHSSSSAPSAPIDLSWTIWLLWIFLCLLGTAVVVVAVVLLRRLFHAREWRRNARTKALAYKDLAAVAVTDWEQQRQFMVLELLVDGELPPKKYWSQPYDDKIAKSLKDGDAATLEFGKLSGGPLATLQGLSFDEYELARDRYESVEAAIAKAKRNFEALRMAAKDDVRAFSYDGQLQQLNELREQTVAIDEVLAKCREFFVVTSTASKVQQLRTRLDGIDEQIVKRANQQGSYEALAKAKGAASELKQEVDEMTKWLDRLADPSGTLTRIVERGRKQLHAFDLDTSQEGRKLDRLQEGIGSVLQKIGPQRSFAQQEAVLSDFQRRVDSVVAAAQVRSNKYRQEQQRQREKARRREERQSNRYDSGGSGSDAFGGAVIGGLLGSSFGSSSSSSSSSSGFDFGGGSSGSWGGGGGDFGGGSSGSW
jgi:uncharacterized membrane protein YgcG